MPQPYKRALSGWKPVILLFLLAGTILFVSYRLEDTGETRSAANPGRGRPEPLNGSSKGKSPPPAGSVGGPRSVVGRKPAGDPGGTRPSAQEIEPFLGPQPAVETGEPPGGGATAHRLQGRVLDASSQPIAAATVTLGERAVVADSQGEFSLPWGTSDLVVRHPNYFPRTLTYTQRRQLMVSGNTQHRSRLLVVLFKGGRIHGRVTNARGEALAEVTVRFVSLPNRLASGSQTVTAKTERGGTYRSPLVHAGPHHVFFHHPGYQSWDTRVEVPVGGAETRCDAVLKTGARMLIAITDADRRRIADARLWLLCQDPDSGVEEVRYLGLTGDNGTLEARWEPQRNHRLRVRMPGFREVERAVYSENITVELAPAPVLAGIATEKKTGLPVLLLAVQLELKTEGGFQRAADRGVLFHSLDQGEFRVGLPPYPGTYRVTLRGEEQLSGTSEPIVFDGHSNPDRIAVRLERRGGLRGDVRYRNSPVSGVRIEVYKESSAPLGMYHGIQIPTPPRIIDSAITDSEGRFEFQHLSPATFRLRAVPSGLAEVYSPPITVPTPAPISLHLQPGAKLRGLTIDADGNPTPDVPLVLVHADCPFPRFTVSNRSGHYQFENLQDGTYSLLLAAPQMANDEPVYTWPAEPSHHFQRDDQHTLTILGGRDVTFNLELRSLRWGSMAAGVFANGKPLSRLALSVRGPVGKASQETTVETNGEGFFRLHGLAPGTYKVVCPYPPIQRTVQIEAGKEGSLQVELRTQSLVVWVTEEQSVPLTRPVIGELFREASESRVARISSENGKLTFPGLYAGRYRLRLSCRGYLGHQEELAVRDQPVELFTSLRRGIPVKVTVVRGSGEPTGRPEPIRGLATVVLFRDGVEIYRAQEFLNGEVLLPKLQTGTYRMTIRSQDGTATSWFKVSKSPEVAPIRLQLPK